MAATTKDTTAQSTPAKQPPEAAKEAPKEAAAPAPAAAVDMTARLESAHAITRRNVLWALGAGVIPFPLVDIFAVSGVHLKMLREFSLLYGMKFQEGLAKKIIGSLITSLGVVGIGGVIGGSLAKFIPGIGTTLSLISVPVLAGATTHALGQVFTLHFEAGGTLLDFDPNLMREYFRKEFEKAKETVSSLQREQKAGAPSA